MNVIKLLVLSPLNFHCHHSGVKLFHTPTTFPIAEQALPHVNRVPSRFLCTYS